MINKHPNIGDKIKFSKKITTDCNNTKYKYDSVEFVVTSKEVTVDKFNREIIKYEITVIKSNSGLYPIREYNIMRSNEYDCFDFVEPKLHNHPLTSMFKNLATK